ncbi:uncharacterized protein N7459_008895, partial [Penicillium hispanicum]|uniref:uncharacterized protein n=1 Tax=Penicillium hispanicum TaxID=1080232 RepID=UPI0025413D9D
AVAGDLQSKACKHCRNVGVQCDRNPVRFRDGLSLPKEPEVAFPDQGIWPRLHDKGILIVRGIHFHDETPEIVGLYLEPLEEPSCPIRSDSTAFLAVEGQNGTHHSDQGHPKQSPLPTNPTVEDLSLLSLSVHSSKSSGRRCHSHPYQPFTEREAILIRNFVENMALWVRETLQQRMLAQLMIEAKADITDPQRHFESEVPIRAFSEPVLRYAILAFSARHLNRQDTGDATEALQYHNRCVQILIPALSEPEKHITEDVLAAVAILRQHEEMDGVDNQFHLTGTTYILNTVSTFGSSGGLGEAAAWLCLRQDIYISLTAQRSLRTNLENFHGSDVFHRDNDFAWSSRMVFLLAKALQSTFSGSAVEGAVVEEVEAWYTSKPYTFEPVRVIPRGSALDRRFPAIWMLLPVHVIGLQYYHLAKIVLSLSECSTSSTAYDSLQHSRKVEKNVRHHLLTVLGLAQSNVRAENALFTARHSLVAWGWVLRHRSDQQAAESLLHDMHARTGWNMDTLIQSLRCQWLEDEGV